MGDKDNIKSGIKKIFMTILTQGIILVLSIITGFVLPQKMGPEDYGYWQIYLFYVAYLNIFGLGYNDGIALFYGGYDYEKLPFKKIRSAMISMYIYLLILTSFLFFIFNVFSDGIYKNIYQMLTLSIPITCIQCVLLTSFLAVNKTGIYNIINLFTKVFSVTFYITLLFFGIKDAKNMMYADFISRLVVFIVCCILGHKILFGKRKPLKEGLKEFKEKSKSGINITLAVIASMFIPVCGRMVIEWNEPIATYGIYSFAMSLLTIIMTFTTTIGYVIFPALKKINEKNLSTYYFKFSFVCDSIIYIALLAYVPLVLIIKYIMKEYTPALNYLFILLAMCVPLGRMQLLITSYYKALRLEKQFLITNIIGMLAMISFTSISYYVFKSVTSVAICTTIVIVVWIYFTEKYLNKKMKNKMELKNIFIQNSMLILFIFAAHFNNLYIFSIVYISSLVIYFVINRNQMKKIFRLLKN